jgi:large subunit ribosomal protein L6
MVEIEIPNGVEVKVEGDLATVKGKHGSTTKRFSSKFISVKVEGKKLHVEASKVKKIDRKAKLAEQAFASELRGAMEGVEKGVQRKLQIIYAHFPISLETKGNRLLIKNIFGERVAREARIYGETKVEVKGQEVMVKGVDEYDVGQTVANIRKMCYACGHDTRVFQDGLYPVKEE